MPKHSDQECKVTSSHSFFLKEIFKNENKNKKKSVFLVKEERTIKNNEIAKPSKKNTTVTVFLTQSWNKSPWTNKNLCCLTNNLEKLFKKTIYKFKEMVYN